MFTKAIALLVLILLASFGGLAQTQNKVLSSPKEVKAAFDLYDSFIKKHSQFSLETLEEMYQEAYLSKGRAIITAETYNKTIIKFPELKNSFRTWLGDGESGWVGYENWENLSEEDRVWLTEEGVLSETSGYRLDFSKHYVSRALKELNVTSELSGELLTSYNDLTLSRSILVGSQDMANISKMVEESQSRVKKSWYKNFRVAILEYGIAGAIFTSGLGGAYGLLEGIGSVFSILSRSGSGSHTSIPFLSLATIGFVGGGVLAYIEKRSQGFKSFQEKEIGTDVYNTLKANPEFAKTVKGLEAGGYKFKKILGSNISTEYGNGYKNRMLFSNGSFDLELATFFDISGQTRVSVDISVNEKSSLKKLESEQHRLARFFREGTYFTCPELYFK